MHKKKSIKIMFFTRFRTHFDDTPNVYEYVTIGRGTDLVYRPYLSLLANLTPDDLKPMTITHQDLPSQPESCGVDRYSLDK